MCKSNQVEIITFMLPPLAIGRCLVQHAAQWNELINWHVFSRNTQFIQELSLCSIPYTWHIKAFKPLPKI